MDQVYSQPVSFRGRNRFRARGLGAAGLGLAASSIPQDAAAVIISDIAISESPNTTFSLNGITPEGDVELSAMTGGMGFDLKLKGQGMGSSSTVQFAISPGAAMNLTLLDVGDTVDGALNFQNDGFLVRQDVTNTEWTPGEIGYAGFVFEPVAGTPLYGWMLIDFDINEMDFTVLQWAYEDNGSFILVGDIGGIPEPSTAFLLGLGLVGLAGVVRRRRRRRLLSDVG